MSRKPTKKPVETGKRVAGDLPDETLDKVAGGGNVPSQGGVPLEDDRGGEASNNTQGSPKQS